MLVSKEKINGFTVKIMYDDDPISPLEWDGNPHIAFFHRRYDYRHGIGKDFSLTDPQSYHDWKRDNPVIAVPLYMLDHSGLRFHSRSFGDPWDSGQVGEVFIPCSEIRKEWGWKRITKSRRAQIVEGLIAFVKELDQYVSGDVYGYDVLDSNGESLDSCWGFYGLESVEEQARSAVEFYTKKRRSDLMAVLVPLGAGL